MKRRRKYRPRLEFLHLESQIDPQFELKAWRRLVDEVVYGKEPEERISCVSQFRLRERIRGRHARRTRWNVRRHLRKRNKLAAKLRPEYVGYIVAGFLDIAEFGGDEIRVDLLRGAFCFDVRLMKKLLGELEIIHEMIDPSTPPYVICQRPVAEAGANLPIYCEQIAFQQSLYPVEVPSTSPDVIPLSPFFSANPTETHAETTKTTQAAS